MIGSVLTPIGEYSHMTRMDYDGLTIRCATTEEHERILAEVDSHDAGDRVFILQTTDTLDYVVAAAVGWREDQEEDRDPSALAFFASATDPTWLLPSDLPTPWSELQADSS